MKNVNKITGLVVLIAIAGLLCAACGGNDPGGSEIPVKVKAYNNGAAPANLSMGRAVGEGRGGLLRAVEHPSF